MHRGLTSVTTETQNSLRLIFQCAENESILRCFYNWGWIKLQSFENWLQFSTVEENCRPRNVRERLCRHCYGLTPKPSGTETYGRLPWQFCNCTCETINERWNFAPKLRSNSSPVILSLKQQYSPSFKIETIGLTVPGFFVCLTFICYIYSAQRPVA